MWPNSTTFDESRVGTSPIEVDQQVDHAIITGRVTLSVFRASEIVPNHTTITPQPHMSDTLLTDLHVRYIQNLGKVCSLQEEGKPPTERAGLVE